MTELSLAMLYNKMELLSITYSTEQGLQKKRVVQLIETTHLL